VKKMKIFNNHMADLIPKQINAVLWSPASLG
jgi:hypothetical protein